MSSGERVREDARERDGDGEGEREGDGPMIMGKTQAAERRECLLI